MGSTVDELSVAYEEGGQVRVKELRKQVLHEGHGWATLVFLSQEWQEKEAIFGPPKVHLRRYRKRGGRYQLYSKFNLPSVSQAQGLAQTLQQWEEDFELYTSQLGTSIEQDGT